jgi:hypothetical protein
MEVLMRGMVRRPFGALLVSVCTLALIACGDSDEDGSTPDSTWTPDVEQLSPDTAPIVSWTPDVQDTSPDSAPNGTSSPDVTVGPDEPDAGPGDPDPPTADVPTIEEEDVAEGPDVAEPTDGGGAPPFEGDAVSPADPTDPLLCTVSGETNDVVDCELHMAALAGSANVAALEFHFPLAPHAELLGISCASGGGADPCQGQMKGPFPTGYTYNASYDATAGAAMILIGLNAQSPLTSAVYDGATITGETFVLAFRLKRLTNVALEVRVPTAVFSDSVGTSLAFEVVDGVWVTSGGP